MLIFGASFEKRNQQKIKNIEEIVKKSLLFCGFRVY